MKKRIDKFISILNNSDKSGQALLLALLIMAGITAAGVGFATLIISQIRASENIENSIIASYAAESGLEKALHIVKTNRATGSTLADTITEIEGLTNLPNFTKVGLSVLYDENGTSSEEVRNKFSLLQDESKQIDLYNPDSPFGVDNGIRYLYVSWDNNPLPISDAFYNNGYGTGPEWIEISWTGWDLNGNSYENVEKILLPSDALRYNSTLCNASSYIQCTTVILDPDSIGLVHYQVRVKALYANVDDIEIKALDDSNNLVNIPSRIRLKTIGKFGRTQQALNASLPWKIPISGLFDYVIFSEEQINKTPETNYQTSGPIEIERGISSDQIKTSCDCISLPDYCTDYDSCRGTVTGCTDIGFTSAYWRPWLYCDKNIKADVGNDLNASGWGTCELYHLPGACYGTQEKAQIEKVITADDLPYNEGDYYVSLRALYNSNQNSEKYSVTIDDGSCGLNDSCQKIEVKDLYSIMANPAVSEYKTCVSQTRLHLEPNYSIIFEFGNGDENSPVNVDWYQFSSGIPPGVSERCDSDFTPLRIEAEDEIPRTEAATSCTCNDAGCNAKGACVAYGWKPSSFGDLSTPIAECFKYNNEAVFPSFGVDTWDVNNRANGWGACLLNSDRWIKYEVPAGVGSGPYYLSLRVGFTEETKNSVQAEIYDGPTVTDRFVSNDLWGSANTPQNAFVECTFPNHVDLESGYEIKLSTTNNDLYIDWLEITDTPPGYRSCNGSAVPQGVIP
jgi:hypothetical protein